MELLNYAMDFNAGPCNSVAISGRLSPPFNTHPAGLQASSRVRVYPMIRRGSRDTGAMAPKWYRACTLRMETKLLIVSN